MILLVPPVASAASVIASTASRLSQEMQSKTSLVRCASATSLGVNILNLSWVSSMTLIRSERTMHAPLSSLNCGFRVRPIAS